MGLCWKRSVGLCWIRSVGLCEEDQWVCVRKISGFV